jgi:sulfur-oxidizing protein SoxX
MKHKITLTVAALVVAGCAALQPLPSAQELDAQATAMMKASFREQGIAKMDRIEQDLGQKACSSAEAPSAKVATQIEEASLASVKWPAGGNYLGDWKEGEKIAQSGRGGTWTDAPGSANGGGCYNCHQVGKAELSYGTVGPSLYNFGKLRGVADPADPKSAEVVKYTWAKLWNSKAYAACSNMPRFGHSGLLSEDQIRHVMALLLDPKSPVNQ